VGLSSAPDLQFSCQLRCSVHSCQRGAGADVARLVSGSRTPPPTTVPQGARSAGIPFRAILADPAFRRLIAGRILVGTMNLGCTFYVAMPRTSSTCQSGSSAASLPLRQPPVWQGASYGYRRQRHGPDM